ncbi:hypothetical protein TIFTF001_023679 [Ficus carica]|uniref:Uncharacterized protein n=1 Tax=Ficus carica TaxID=3494 RepID=A0AA88DFH2_FICCA|nr:hypothetical protein TIFTF001_023679 [Ficus carica]
MRLQWPRFSLKPEPDRAQDPCTARIGSTGDLNEIGNSCTGFLENNAEKEGRTQQCPNRIQPSDTTNANKVSNLLATADARWWSVAGQAVKCGSLQSPLHQQELLRALGLHPPPTSTRKPSWFWFQLFSPRCCGCGFFSFRSISDGLVWWSWMAHEVAFNAWQMGRSDPLTKSLISTFEHPTKKNGKDDGEASVREAAKLRSSLQIFVFIT